MDIVQAADYVGISCHAAKQVLLQKTKSTENAINKEARSPTRSPIQRPHGTPLIGEDSSNGPKSASIARNTHDHQGESYYAGGYPGAEYYPDRSIPDREQYYGNQEDGHAREFAGGRVKITATYEHMMQQSAYYPDPYYGH